MTARTTTELAMMANTLRAHAMRMTTAAGSGHPTSCASLAEIMSVLFFDQMQWDPSDPHANDVDHFLLSKGHAAPILWAALKEAGAITEDLLTLRQLTSPLEGHPTPNSPWARIATGSLGQGLSAGCGMALAKVKTGNPSLVFVAMGDGESAEGSVWEAAQFASHYRLTNLCAIVDLNRLGQSGTSYFEHNAAQLAGQWKAFGWNALVVDGHDVDALRTALAAARTATQPTVLIAKTFKGKNILDWEDKPNCHGKPLPKDHLEKALAQLKTNEGALRVTPRRVTIRKPHDADQPNKMAALRYELGQSVATREAYGSGLVRLAAAYPGLVALDADTKNSTFSDRLLLAKPDNFVECFIAEQNMVGVGLGFAAMGWIPCMSTFACFLSRAYDFLRMGVVSRPAHCIVSGSHCGVSIGEDGPSQMALEDLAMMRGLVQSTVVYPCDAVSTERVMEELVKVPGVSYLRTSRPKTPVLYKNDEQFPLGGSKTLRQSADDRCTIVAAGVTVHEALKAADQLKAGGFAVRIIDAYSIKPIDAATLQKAARETKRIITVEDHSVSGGLGEAVCAAVAGLCPVMLLGVREIPRSGPPEALLAMHHIDAAAIAKAALG